MSLQWIAFSIIIFGPSASHCVASEEDRLNSPCIQSRCKSESTWCQSFDTPRESFVTQGQDWELFSNQLATQERIRYLFRLVYVGRSMSSDLRQMS